MNVPQITFKPYIIAEDGKATNRWLFCFRAASGKGTKVEVDLRFDKEADIQQILAMGFEGGFFMAPGSLDELLAAGM